MLPAPLTANWQAAPRGPDLALDVSCTASTFCVAVDEFGDATSFTGNSWGTPVELHQGAMVDSVSCTSPSFCVATDDKGAAMAYDGSTWSAPQTIDSPPPSPGVVTLLVSCASMTFCLATGNDGNAEV